MDDIVLPSRFKTAPPYGFRDVRILRQVLLLIPVGRRRKLLLDKSLMLDFNPNPFGKSGHDSERYGGEYENREDIFPSKFLNFFLYVSH